MKIRAKTQTRFFEPGYWLILAGIAYGVLIYLLLPDVVTTINDEFGYLRSVIGTLQHGRAWTDDWLAPWNASFESLSAMLLIVSGSFYFATYGLLAILAAATFWSICALLSEQGLSVRNAVVLSALVMTFPSLMWSSLEYSGMALYMLCFLLALWASKKHRWWLFLFVWGIGIATRQSAIAWAAMPVLSTLHAWRLGKRDKSNSCRTWQTPLLVALAGVLLFSALNVWMNKTHAQTIVTDHIFDQLDLQHATKVFIIGAALYLLAAGLGAFLLHWSKLLPMVPRWYWPWTIAFLALIGLGQLILDGHQLILNSHDSYSRHWGSLYLNMLIVIAAVGWLSAGVSLRLDNVMCALSAIALLCLFSGKIYDRYFFDTVAFGFFGVATTSQPIKMSVYRLRKLLLAANLVLLMIAFLHAGFVLNFKKIMDGSRATCDLTEHALRSGLLNPVDIPPTQFGFAGWYLYPYYIMHEGREDRDIVGFLRLLRRSVQVRCTMPNILQIFPSSSLSVSSEDMRMVIAEGTYRFVWFFHADFYLLRVSPERVGHSEADLCTAGYSFEPFPLNDREWCELIRRVSTKTTIVSGES